MIQLIVVIIIVAMAFGAAGLKIYQRLFRKSKTGNACDGCAGCALKHSFNQRQQQCQEHPEEKKKWASQEEDDSKGIA